MDAALLTLLFVLALVLLLGGGFALAEGFVTSGLSETLAEELSLLKALPVFLVMFLCVLAVSFITEVMSNTAAVSIILPVVAKLAVSIGQNPLCLAFPLTISSSFAFILPVATPPNAIVFSANIVSVLDMMKV